MTLPTDTDCVLVGGNPAALLLALLLARGGRRVHVLERQERFGLSPAGIVLQPGTLQILDELGVLDEVRLRSAPLRGIEEYGPSGLLLHRDYAEIPGAPVDVALVTPLSVLRATLLRKVEQQPLVRVHMGAEVHDLPSRRGRFAVRVRSGRDGELEFLPRVVVAADGKFSTTRTRAGIEVRVDEFEHQHLVLRAPRPGGWPDRMRAYTGGRFLFTTPGADGRLHLFWLLAPAAIAALQQEGPPALAAGVAALEPALAPVVQDPAQLQVTAVVRYHTVRPTTWQRGNVVLLGDAAHGVHSFGGQGMNLALQDATLLAEVVERALASAEVEVLGRFETMRRRYVEQLQDRQQWAVRHTLEGGAASAGIYGPAWDDLALGQPELRPWTLGVSERAGWSH